MMKKLVALLLACLMAALCCSAALADPTYGPVYDDWSEMTDQELYALALEEKGELTVYATSSKMLSPKWQNMEHQSFPST